MAGRIRNEMQRERVETMDDNNPTRVELPGEAFQRRSVAPTDTSGANDVPDMPAERTKPKLGIRRRPSTEQNNNVVSNAVASVEERYNAAARKERAERLKKGISNFISIVLLIALLAGGYVAYDHWKKGDISDVASTLIDSISQEHESEQQDHVDTADNDAQEIKTDVAPVQKQEQPIVQKEETPDTTIKDTAATESYVQIVNRLHGARLMLWRNLDKSQKPGKVDAVFIALIPVSRGNVSCYEITSTKNGISSVARVNKDGIRENVAVSAFESQLESKGGFIYLDGVMYAFRAKTANKEWQAPRTGETFDPANQYFGSLLNVIDEFGLDASKLKYEVSFVPPNGGDAISIADIKHGKTLRYDSFEKIAAPIAKNAQLKTVSGFKPQKYKKTVVFYDGAFVGKGHGGETLVPRQWAQAQSGPKYIQWVSLRDEAYRQEREAQRVAEENARKAAERKAKLNASPDSQTIRKVLQEGKIIIRANVKGTK